MNFLQTTALRGIKPFPMDRCIACRDDGGSPFRALVENTHIAVVVAARNGIVLFANAAAGKLLQSREGGLVGKPFGFALADGANTEIEIHRQDGDTMVVEMQVSITRWEDSAVAYVVSLHDISAYRKLKTSLQKSNDRLRALLNASPLAIITLDGDARIMLWNQGAEKLFGWSERDLVGQTMPVLSADGREEIRRHCQYALQNKTIAGVELTKQCRRNGSSLDIAIWVAPLCDAHSLVSGVLLIVADITAHKVAEAQIRFLSNYSVLTGLPKREMFLECLRITLELASGADSPPGAILYLGLDRFKQVNECLGHDVGDDLLRQTGERLKLVIREMDVLSHVSGDEFAIFLPSVRDAQDAGRVANKILGAFAEPFLLAESLEVFASASVGIAIYPNDGDTAVGLVQSAEAGMRRAKQNGGNHYQFFTPEMNTSSLQRISLESSLRRALERDEFILHFQPQLDIASGRIIGAEALVRWVHPERGIVPPGQFISVAEECGLIIPLGEWVLRRACQQAFAWQKAGMPEMTVAVNVSPLQFRRNIHHAVSRLLKETGLEARLLEIEITEGTVMENPAATAVMLAELKSMGVKISIDDFGMGYSSLSLLKRFPIDKLKIDQSFIRDLTIDPDEAAIVGAIVTMAKSLKLQVIAEGVETLDQLHHLRMLQCEEIQGFLLSKALPADAFETFLREWQGMGALSDT
ncbi:MAG: EAL domain-containing protein [Sulfuricella sp.]